MAIEGVMQIFLMVAVIIVGMSFLLKAFGIDLIEWLKDKLGGLGLNDGRVLHVKADPGDSPPEIWEFHLGNEERHLSEEHNPTVGTAGEKLRLNFYSPFETGKCLIYLTDEESRGKLGTGVALVFGGGGEPEDQGRTYYINPGALVQDGCGDNINQCVGSFAHIPDQLISKDTQEAKNNLQIGGPSGTRQWGCIQLKAEDEEKVCKDCGDRGDCRQPYAHVDCAGEKRGGCDGRTETDQTKTVDFMFFGIELLLKDCKEGKRECNLLDFSTEDSGKIRYKIKYGLLCADDGKWHTCKKQTGSTGIIAKVKGKDIDCTLSSDVFIWDENKVKEALASSTTTTSPTQQPQQPTTPTTQCTVSDAKASGSFSLDPNPATAGQTITATVSKIPSQCDGKELFIGFVGDFKDCTLSGGTCSSTIGPFTISSYISVFIDLDGNNVVDFSNELLFLPKVQEIN